ncbi:unnamed protein product, partial [Phaeothamnion confervicola]
ERDAARRAVRSRQLSVPEVFAGLTAHLLKLHDGDATAEVAASGRDGGRAFRVPALVDHISRHASGDGGGGQGMGPAAKAAESGPAGLEDMLWRACERGTRPLIPWRTLDKPAVLSAGAVARLCQGRGMSFDNGWQAFAGSIQREEAETILRGRPQGTFLLRRKTARELVLSFVAAPSKK